MSRAAPPPRIEIVVDELVLHGISADRAEAVASSLRDALAERFARAATQPAPREARLERVAVGALPREPAACGDSIAAGVWTAVSRGGAR